MTASDLQAALEPVLAALAALSVPYFVAGSVASSARGVARASLDADIVADLGIEHTGPLVAALAADYYVDEDRVRAAIAARRSFNVIHLATMFKVDLFLSRKSPFDASRFARATPEQLWEEESLPRVPVSSTEDLVLAKLEWYRAGGGVSERQWRDVVGLIKVGGRTLDVAYMKRWANTLGVTDLLDAALARPTAQGS